MFYGTFSDWAERLGVWGLRALDATARAIDHFRRNLHLVQLAPVFSDFSAQFIVIVQCRDTCFTSLTVHNKL